MIINILTRHRVVTITLGFGTEGTDHLRVAEEAALVNVYIPASQANRVIRLVFSTGVVVDFLRRRNDFQQTAPEDDQYGR